MQLMAERVEDSSLEPNMPLPGCVSLTKCGPGNFTVEKYSDALSGVDPPYGLALGDTSAAFQTSNQVHHTVRWVYV